MKSIRILSIISLASLTLASCQKEQPTENSTSAAEVQTPVVAQPTFVSDTVINDTDDPAIWVHPSDPAQSLIIGTDKGGDDPNGGGVYVFDLQGKIVKSITGMTRLNNVDVEQGVNIDGEIMDIAVVTERGRDLLRIFSLPALDSIDDGGLPVFADSEEKAPMGVSLYKRTSDSTVFAIVGRKFGPTEGYLYQYQLVKSAEGTITGELVRKFGKFSGKKEIEAIAVDDELGYVYCSDENIGVRKYYADPEKGNEELALFGTEGFTDDHEGISIYKTGEGTGYILVSDQQANQFQVFSREGTLENPHQHTWLGTIKTSTVESDGSESISQPLGDRFPKGMFVAMSDDKTFQIYAWEELWKGFQKRESK